MIRPPPRSALFPYTPLFRSLAGFEQRPVVVSQVPATWHWSRAVQTTGVLVQVPVWQLSPVVQARPSLQLVPLGLAGFEQRPVGVLQVPASWHWSWAVQTTGVPRSEARRVGEAGGSRGSPFHLKKKGMAGFEQRPVVVSQVPATWHWSRAVQTTGVTVQVPVWQLSPVVQARPSLQLVPLGLAGFEQTPVVVLHVPASWHWSWAVQTTGVP